MTDIAFHFNVSDKLAYSCRLLRKAVHSGAKVVVIGTDAAVRQLDQDLWTFSATDFLPHCVNDAGIALVRRSPILLTDTLHPSFVRDVLVNLTDHVPDGFDGFGRVVEVVGKVDEDRYFARQRWKSYSKSGFNLIQHDQDSKSPP